MNKTWRVNVYPEDSLQITDFQMKCLYWSTEICHLKTTFKIIIYPANFFYLCIKLLLNNLYRPNVIIQNVPEIIIFAILATLFEIPKKLQIPFTNKMTFCN